MGAERRADRRRRHGLSSSPERGAAPLSQPGRARGRRLAIASHPFSMTFWHAFSEQLPTLALVSLGAGEAVIGVQNGLPYVLQGLQLPTLRLVGRVAKRRILVAGHLLALAAAAPLMLFASFAALGPDVAVALVLSCLLLTGAGLRISNTVWFPLLNAYMEPGRTGRFFGTIRSVWHGALILYYLAAQAWLAGHPGDFAPLFAGAWLCGLLRLLLIVRLPERSERRGERLRIRDAFALVRDRLELRRYLLGVVWFSALRKSTLPFAIVMLRREVGFSDSEVLLTTIAGFAGGFVSLYLWGRIGDRFGPLPVLVATSIGSGLVLLPLTMVSEPDAAALALAVGVFFGLAVLASGFGVADTQILFGLTPPESPTSTMVIAGMTSSVLAGLAPIAVGLLLDLLLGATQTPLGVYRAWFGLAAALQALAFLPLLRFRRASIQ